MRPARTLRAMAPIVLFTDFGVGGPWGGQVKAVLAREAPGAVVLDLLADAPAHDVEAAAYLLAAFAPSFGQGSVFVCVVDPGVGTARRAACVHDGDRWFVGPDNGLFNVVAARAEAPRWWDITWRPEHLSATFHGRDLFAPVAARIARGEAPPGDETDAAARIRPGWPADLARIVYVDTFGNAMTGIRAAALGAGDRLSAGSGTFVRARTFADVAPGAGMWFENANGLAEIAVNSGRADQVFGIAVGTAVAVHAG